MSHDQLILACLLVSACVTGVCTVLASLATVREAKRMRMRLEKERLTIAGQKREQGPAARIHVWEQVGRWVVLTSFLIATLVVQVVSLSKITTYPWKERVQSKEWLEWRQKVHKKLSVSPVSEQTLKEVLSSDLPKLGNIDDAPDRLRRDQAIADVLLSYSEVSEILKKRLGIYPDSFLGTGFSRPKSSDVHIASAQVHEYLIPNHSDTHDKVWTWQIKPVRDDLLKRSIKQIIEGGPAIEGGLTKDMAPLPPSKDKDGAVRNVQEICDRVKHEKQNERKEKSAPAVIRFAQFPAEKYKNTLGRPDAWRVFASNLSEVWDLTLKDASMLSGYIPQGDSNDTFFILIYLPDNEEDVVPATWGSILRHFAKWSEAKSQVPPL